MKKALIITYYWPPAGGSGVQRWLKFVKYLPQFGWEPVVYTQEGGEVPVTDHSLEKDIPAGITVLKRRIWEPYALYKKFTGQQREERIAAGFLTEKKKPKLSEKLSVWVRGNLFIPDSRKFWIAPSVRYLSAWLAKNPVDVIVSTGPPHSMHLIALGLKKKLGLPWVADFRDPWTNIDFYKDLMLTARADRKHRALEREVLGTADCTIAVGETLGRELMELGARRVEVITNGFDEDDYPAERPTLDKKFSIAHVGTMVKTRNPGGLWQALAKLVKEDSRFAGDLEIKLVGKVDVTVTESIERHGLTGYLNRIDYLPHDLAILELMKSRVLLLVLNDTPNARGILTGKLFEYLGAGRPLLCLGAPDGDAAKIVQESNAGFALAHSDAAGIAEALRSLYENPQASGRNTSVNRYSRKALAEKAGGVMQFPNENLHL